MPIIQRGLDSSQEQDPNLLIRDTRTLGQRIADFFKNPAYVTVLLVGMAMTVVMMPAVNDIVFLIGIFCFWYAFTRKAVLPFRMPQRSNQKDYNDPAPGSTKPRKARGIC